MTEDSKDLIADLKALRGYHEFTRDRVGQEGCPVRLRAAEYVKIIDRAIAAIADGAIHAPVGNNGGMV